VRAGPLPEAKIGKQDTEAGVRNAIIFGKGKIVFVILWQFDIAEAQVPAFEAAYGASGSWAQLFARSADYLGTELMRDAYVPGRYLTVDRWQSEEGFRAFRAAHDSDYESLDRACDTLIMAESRIGAFQL
jgi:heme-degrading monooxygenase HmoA